MNPSYVSERLEESTLALLLTGLSFLLLNAYLLSYFANAIHRAVIVRAYGLALAFHLGTYIVLAQPPQYKPLGLQIMLLSVFHFGEYLTTALFQPSTLTLESFILNHSWAYNVAMTACFIENFIVTYFVPQWQLNNTRIYIGLAVSLFGDFVRKLAMATAGESFSHYVRFVKRDSHVLITSGIYSLVRHPSYAGWFLWSVFTQVMLGNPVCSIAFLLVTWKFFDERIREEERFLLYFFQRDYVDYQRAVKLTGVPFVSGFKSKTS